VAHEVPHWSKYVQDRDVYSGHETSAYILNLHLWPTYHTSYGTVRRLTLIIVNEQQTSKMKPSNVSTAVKIVVSMVVVAALAATRFSSKVRYRVNVVHGANILDWALLSSNGESP
jgi:hypothetical protein